jgi:hypothetical protein
VLKNLAITEKGGCVLRLLSVVLNPSSGFRYRIRLTQLAVAGLNSLALRRQV